MGSINYGALKAMPAERMGGLVFVERFESAAEVVKNGGVIAAGLSITNNAVVLDATTKRISYQAPSFINSAGFTVMLDLEITSLAGAIGGLICQSTNAWTPSSWAIYVTAANKINFTNVNLAGNPRGVETTNAITTGKMDVAVIVNYAATNKVEIYINGALAGSSTDAQISSTRNDNLPISFGTFDAGLNSCACKISNAKIFKTTLDAATILSYANGTIWNYDNNCVLWMDGKLKNYDSTNTRILDASKNGNNMTLTASGFTKSLKKGYTQNVLTTATGYVTALNNTILAANSGTQTLFWLGKINGLNYTPLLGNSNFAVGLTNGQKVYSRSFKPDKSYTNRITTEKIRPNQINSVCSVKSSNTLSVFINGIKTALTASEVGYERDITKFAFGYDLDLYADLADITTTSAADVICFAFFNIAINQIQAIDLHLRMSQDQEV